MKLSQVKEYVTGVLKQWFTNKPILDKFNETETGELLYGTKAISSNPVLKYQKYLNTELDYCYLKHGLTEDIKLAVGDVVPFIYYNGNMETNTDNHSIILKTGKTYKISCDVYSGKIGCTVFNIFDLTNNKIISQFIKAAANHSTNACNTAGETIYTPENDCEIQVRVDKVEGEQYLRTFNDRSSFIVQEINRQIIIDPVEHVNTEQGLEDTPVGHIISHMGIEAPNHYLICDGAEYNIADYPHLAQHMVDSFGSVNHFGGDGITTFAVPDLRGEFLRGTGTATRDTGSGGEIGEHQDGTQHVDFRINENNAIFMRGGVGTPRVANIIDKEITTNTVNAFTINNTKYDAWVGSGQTHYTSRPTNTSVLYCIKYEPTYYTNVYNPLVGRSETILFEGNYSESNNSNTLTTGITLNDSIENYNELYVEVMYENSGSKIYGHLTTYIKIDSLIGHYGYPTIELFCTNGTSDCLVRINCGFIDDKTLSIGWINESVNWHSPYISKIIGVKYQEAQLENNTDEDINSAIAEAVAEINEEV